MKKKKGLKIVLIILILLVIAGFGALGYYLHQQANSGLFFEDTKINGYNVAGKTAKQVYQMLEKSYTAPTVTLREQDEDALLLTFADMGYTIDDAKLLSNIQDCMKEQTARLLFSLMDGNEFEIQIPFNFDQTVFDEAVNQKKLAKPRVSSVDASMEFNGTEYYIQPEIYGTEMDDADLRVMVKDLADRMTASDRPQENAVLNIPESFYFVPAVVQTNEQMNTLMNIYNSFCKAKITYVFGEQKESIDWNTIQNWLRIENDEAILLEEDIYNYVSTMAYHYDTLYYARDFVANSGAVVHYESSDYGYQIDQDAEFSQLVQDIYNNTEVEREPIYAVKGYRRNGYDDVCGNYVEADLTRQHLWFYKDGQLVIESDFVSGLPKNDRETITGAFGIPYKKSPEILIGQSENYETPVTYWMPFNMGQGLHDAYWRTSFGGNIYQTDGSHGCINLPTESARIIYENMEERMPIFVHK